DTASPGSRRSAHCWKGPPRARQPGRFVSSAPSSIATSPTCTSKANHPKEGNMHVRFWGTRGSIATPGPGTVRFGGNTSCVEVSTNAGATLILDCGTGARALGAAMMAPGAEPITATILLSHTHWDHIQGFPFFDPLFVAGNRITVCGPEGSARSL